MNVCHGGCWNVVPRHTGRKPVAVGARCNVPLRILHSETMKNALETRRTAISESESPREGI
jgi:hypothetical protein